MYTSSIQTVHAIIQRALAIDWRIKAHSAYNQ